MAKSKIEFLEKPEMEKPIFIEGLPGLGYVGKVAADHLVEEFEAKKFAKMSSPHFPHHVSIDSESIFQVVRNEFYYTEIGENDTIILAGDFQATSSKGHYEVANKILDFIEDFDVSQIFTLGGYATGEYSRTKPKVIGVVNSPDLLEEYQKIDLKIDKNTGPIIGVSGLLLGLGELRNIKGVCLLGETHGMVVDYRSARSVLEVLADLLDFEVDLSKLEERAKKTEQLLKHVSREMRLRKEHLRKEEEEKVSYIG